MAEKYPKDVISHWCRIVLPTWISWGVGGLKISHDTDTATWIPETTVTSTSGWFSFFIQGPIVRSKLKPNKIWNKLARMQEMQRVKTIPKSGKPTQFKFWVGLSMKVNVRQKPASRDSGSSEIDCKQNSKHNSNNDPSGCQRIEDDRERIGPREKINCFVQRPIQLFRRILPLHLEPAQRNTNNIKKHEERENIFLFNMQKPKCRQLGFKHGSLTVISDYRAEVWE